MMFFYVITQSKLQMGLDAIYENNKQHSIYILRSSTNYGIQIIQLRNTTGNI